MPHSAYFQQKAETGDTLSSVSPGDSITHRLSLLTFGRGAVCLFGLLTVRIDGVNMVSPPDVHGVVGSLRKSCGC